MKKFLTGVVAVATLFLISCESKTKLADDIAGTWSGTPERLDSTDDETITSVETISFIKDQSEKPAGELIIQSMISVTGAVQPDSMLVQPYALSEAAVATAQGSWTVVDDDEISISIDPQSVKVSIDPDAVSYNDNVFTDAQKAMLDSIRPSVAADLQSKITKYLTDRFVSVNHLDDVKVKGNLLKFEIGRKHFVLSKQGD
ncbi:MAG: hypothetical protein J1E38_08125 [Paramuribaculum sp.]|nr:hypothetical protein [Paramuribaculum sp.]